MAAMSCDSITVINRDGALLGRKVFDSPRLLKDHCDFSLEDGSKAQANLLVNLRGESLFQTVWEYS